MRRADPSPMTHPHADLDGALSDVSSSPRSVSAGIPSATGGRSGCVSEDPPGRPWEENAFSVKVKLMCSYGGRILPRPHDNQLRYVGGESRIVVVNRNVSFGDLTSKLSRMFGSAVLVKYQLPCEDLDALISVTSDEDLENMMEEYDRLQAASAGTRAPSSSSRLRLFLFPAKLERSQTSSLSDILEGSHSRDRWFVDALNGLPLPRMRSETSSILSETTEYMLQNNIEGLEEWARAASYGNSGGGSHHHHHEALSEKNYSDSMTPAALFGSLLQHSGSHEISSAPGSPSPIKAGKSSFSGSSSSAPPAVMSLISAIAEAAASRGHPTATQQAGSDIDGNLMAVLLRRGSGDSSDHGGFSEQRRYGLGEVSPASDITRSSTGTGEDAKLHVDEENIMHQKVLTNGSSDHLGDGQQKSAFGYETSADSSKGAPPVFGLGLQETKIDSSKGVPSVFGLGLHEKATDGSKGSTASRESSEIEIPAVIGHPIFDEEPSLVQTISQNVKAMRLEERDSSCTAAQNLTPITQPGQASNIGSTAAPPNITGADRLKQQVPPIATHVVTAKSTGEERLLPQAVPLSTNVSAKSNTEEKFMQQVPSTLAQVSQPILQPISRATVTKRAGEDQLLQHISPSTGSSKDVDKSHQLPPPSTFTSSNVTSSAPPLVQSATVTQKLAVPPNVYQLHQPQQSYVETISVSTYATQAASVQLPVTTQVQSVSAGLSTTQTHVKQNVVPPAANMVSANRVPVSRTQSPPKAAPAASSFQPQRVKTISPSSAQPTLVTAPTPVEGGKAVPPIFTNMVPSQVFSSTAEGVKVIQPGSHQQVEAAPFQRQMSDPLPVQRGVPVVSAQPSSGINNKDYHQYMPLNPSAQLTATGMPSRFRAMGRPVQQVPEGFSNQVSTGIVPEKKPNVPVQRVGPASIRPQVVSTTQYGYYIVEQPNNTSTTMGAMPIYNVPSNAMIGGAANSSESVPYVGANPFVDDFSKIPYQDVPEVSTAEQLQRRQMWP